MNVTIEQLQVAYSNKGYKIFKGDGVKDFDVNIFGIRSSNNCAGEFDDKVGMFWLNTQGNWQLEVYEATTDPGQYWLDHPMNVKGTAILVPGQYRGSHRIGLHRGQYKALVQKGKLSVYRDNSKDEILDKETSTIMTGLFGINIHKASSLFRPAEVGRWSAGCQVIADPDYFEEFMHICKLASKNWGNSFSYTLLDEHELN